MLRLGQVWSWIEQTTGLEQVWCWWREEKLAYREHEPDECFRVMVSWALAVYESKWCAAPELYASLTRFLKGRVLEVDIRSLLGVHGVVLDGVYVSSGGSWRFRLAWDRLVGLYNDDGVDRRDWQRKVAIVLEKTVEDTPKWMGPLPFKLMHKK